MKKVNLNKTALEEAHMVLSDAYQELAPFPEAVQGIAQALDLVTHQEARHRYECQACQRGEACPSLLIFKEVSLRLTLALEILSRFADLQLEYIRDGVDVLGQELWGPDKNSPKKPREKLSLEVIKGEKEDDK